MSTRTAWVVICDVCGNEFAESTSVHPEDRSVTKAVEAAQGVWLDTRFEVHGPGQLRYEFGGHACAGCLGDVVYHARQLAVVLGLESGDEPEPERDEPDPLEPEPEECLPRDEAEAVAG